ncbi:MAG: PilN domain-containing protein [Gammaproteobacteria bacterium]|nr:PilN domain-containing protein [Gammaproteobacteria bacterium]
MTTRINLLPWREIRRREQDRRLFSVGIGAWLLAGAGVAFAAYQVSDMIEHQNNRNTYLQKEITKLETQIKEINQLKKRKQALLARMQVIQQLQGNRKQIVHVFDDLVRKLPKGVYFTQLDKKKQNITLQGFAESNARISALMRNLDSSDWFSNANLDVINVTPKGGNRISKFTLRVAQESKEDKQAAAQTAPKNTTGTKG